MNKTMLDRVSLLPCEVVTPHGLARLKRIAAAPFGVLQAEFHIVLAVLIGVEVLPLHHWCSSCFMHVSLVEAHLSVHLRVHVHVREHEHGPLGDTCTGQLPVPSTMTVWRELKPLSSLEPSEGVETTSRLRSSVDTFVSDSEVNRSITHASTMWHTR